MSNTEENHPGICFEETPEQQEFRRSIRNLIDNEFPKNWCRDLEESKEFPWELHKKLAEFGFYGVGIEEQYGGQGGDFYEQMIVADELARTLAGLVVIWAVTSWSAARALIDHGTEQQKKYYLPKIASGEIMFAFSMTEPGGGTDVLRAMKTKARKVDGGYILNGNKIWSTMAHVAHKLMVIARTSEHDKPSKGLTIFIVDGKADGVEANTIPKLGARAAGSCEVAYQDVFVPESDVIGEVDKGWVHLVGTLDAERLQIAAHCVGILRGILEDAIEYANQRHAFGKPIGAHQAIQHKIAEMAISLETAKLHTYRGAWLLASGKPAAVEATMAKCLASELATKAADDGIQILGGYGYANEYNMHRYWRDVRLYRIGPITTEMSLNYIGESLGLPKSY